MLRRRDRATSPPGERDDTAPQRLAQSSAADLVVRLEQIENHLRQLTGAIEQLQFRNQQLDQQLRRLQDENDPRARETGARAAPGARAAVPPAAAPQPAQVQSAIPARRSEVFDPALTPNAPGAPRPLGTTAPSPPLAGDEIAAGDAPPVGAPGGRAAGAPLDLSTLAGSNARDPALAPPPAARPGEGGLLPPPPPRNPSATGAQVLATLPPARTPKDDFDAAYGQLTRKDYAVAEEGFRAFVRKFPSDPLAGDAQYWMAESMFQRQRYRDAADHFLTMSQKYDRHARAADALLRLGQSLAALGEKELACATLGEIARKYPRASRGVKQGVDREQKRARC
ncbi:MAG: tol-pal system protein YbgF [Proteobacteria bacterium]|nr:tol-pal system protein YbgF [Pseudomonadota bacterium]